MVAFFVIHIALKKCATEVADLYLWKCRALQERIAGRVSPHVLIRMFTHMTSNVACEAAVVRPASLTPLFTAQFEQADNWHPIKYFLRWDSSEADVQALDRHGSGGTKGKGKGNGNKRTQPGKGAASYDAYGKRPKVENSCYHCGKARTEHASGRFCPNPANAGPGKGKAKGKGAGKGKGKGKSGSSNEPRPCGQCKLPMNAHLNNTACTYAKCNVAPQKGNGNCAKCGWPKSTHPNGEYCSKD